MLSLAKRFKLCGHLGRNGERIDDRGAGHSTIVSYYTACVEGMETCQRGTDRNVRRV